MDQAPIKEYYPWDKCVADIDVLAGKIQAAAQAGNKVFDGVYGIPRGGLILAVLLSHKLELPMLLAPTSKSLVVDDIADTGKTLQHFHDIGTFIVTLYYHQQSLIMPSLWLHEKGDKWVVFPWEVE